MRFPKVILYCLLISITLLWMPGDVLQASTDARRVVPWDTLERVQPFPDTRTRVYQTHVPVYGYEVVAEYPHDPGAFTQGLVYENGHLFEGTGLRGRSSLRKVVLENGQVLRKHDLDDSYFGEGIAVVDDRIIQLTWQSHQGFVYDKATFEQIKSFTYPTEGWGITYDGERLIMSDGTATLYFWDPDTLAEIGRVIVHDELGTVRRLNELEYINGEIYANIWLTDVIARIDPDTGRVLGYIDLTGLLAPADRTQKVDVLNGIAYDATQDRLFVTGKLWPKLFHIELIETNYSTYLNRLSNGYGGQSTMILWH